VAATKGRSGNALTVRRRHGTGMERATQLRNGDGERAAPTTAHGVRERERERDGHKRDKSVKRLGSSVNHSLALCCAAVSFPPLLSRPSRLRFPYEFTTSPLPLRIYTTSAQNKDCHILTTHHSLSIHPPLSHLISFSHCPHHSVCYGILGLHQHHHHLCSCHTYPSLSTS
jgi:hypothetical protein